MKKKWGSVPKLITVFTVVFLLLVLSVSLAVFFVSRRSVFFGLSRLNFVLTDAEERVFVLSLEGTEGLVLKLAGEDKVFVPGGFGEYELRKVWGLGELESRGGDLLVKTAEENFSIPIFGYFRLDQPVYSQTDNPKVFISRIFWRGLRGNLKTSLAKKDCFWLFLLSLRLGGSQTKTRDFSPGLSDFKDKKLREEALSIEVLNGTEISGLAQSVAQFLDRAGGRVVRIADSEKEVSQCRLVVSREVRDSYTLRWLKMQYDCRLEETTEESPRAQIRIVLGDKAGK